jgi:hypothetical protein
MFLYKLKETELYDIYQIAFVANRKFLSLGIYGKCDKKKRFDRPYHGFLIQIGRLAEYGWRFGIQIELFGKAFKVLCPRRPKFSVTRKSA